MWAAVIAISFVPTCFGLGSLMGWLDELKWTAPERAFKSFMKKKSSPMGSEE